MLDEWVFTEREPPSLNWERGGIIDDRAQERRMLEKCEVTRLFQYPEDIQVFISTGVISRRLCQDLRSSYYLWNETRAGISLRRAKKKWKDKLKK